MMPPPLVSVIIVNHDGSKVIDRCLDTVLRSDYPRFEVTVVENGSIDGSAELLRQRSNRDRNFRLIIEEHNLGFAEGNNVGARFAKGQYLFFLNDDTEVTADSISNLVTVLERKPLVAEAQSKLLMLTDKQRLDSAGDTIGKVGWPFPVGKNELDRGQYDEQREIFSARGAAMMIKTDVFRKVEGFDADYFMYYEDVDLSWRVRLSGYVVAFAPKSIVYHLGGLANSKEKRALVGSFYSGRNYMSTLVKNLEILNLLIYGPIQIAVHMTTILLYILQRRRQEALGLILSLQQILKDVRKCWRKRLQVQSSRRVSDGMIFANLPNNTIGLHLRSSTNFT
jgi:GT2 family glycosyltransferase